MWDLEWPRVSGFQNRTHETRASGNSSIQGSEKEPAGTISPPKNFVRYTQEAASASMLIPTTAPTSFANSSYQSLAMSRLSLATVVLSSGTKKSGTTLLLVLPDTMRATAADGRLTRTLFRQLVQSNAVLSLISLPTPKIPNKLGVLLKRRHIQRSRTSLFGLRTRQLHNQCFASINLSDENL